MVGTPAGSAGVPDGATLRSNAMARRPTPAFRLASFLTSPLRFSLAPRCDAVLCRRLCCADRSLSECFCVISFFSSFLSSDPAPPLLGRAPLPPQQHPQVDPRRARRLPVLPSPLGRRHPARVGRPRHWRHRLLRSRRRERGERGNRWGVRAGGGPVREGRLRRRAALLGSAGGAALCPLVSEVRMDPHNPPAEPAPLPSASSSRPASVLAAFAPRSPAHSFRPSLFLPRS